MNIARQVLEFVDVPTGGSWALAPEQAVQYFRNRGLQPTFNWYEMLGEEHARAFTVAKLTDTDLLAAVQQSLDEALANGVPFKAWAEQLIPKLQDRGWWGRRDVVAPGGNPVNVQLGSPARLQTIYRSNVQSAYAAGQWDAIADQAELAPYLLYDAVDDGRTRPEHRAWDGTVLPVSHVWWRTHYPPNGWNCRCSVIQLSDDDLADMGLQVTDAPASATVPWTNPATGKVERIPEGIDPGWQTNIGEARNRALAKAVADKVKTYPANLQAPAAKGLEAAARAGKKAAADAGASTSTGMATSGLAKGASRAAERSAQRKIVTALDENTPYLAPALRSLQATDKGKALPASQQLLQAQAQASRLQASAGLQAYRKAVMADRKPSARAQAAFEALPDDAQLALRSTIESQRADSALQAAARAELGDIRAMPEGSPQRAALEAVEAWAGDAKPSELLAAVMVELRTAESRQALATALLEELRAELKAAGVTLPDEQLQAMVDRIRAGRGLV